MGFGVWELQIFEWRVFGTHNFFLADNVKNDFFFIAFSQQPIKVLIFGGFCLVFVRIELLSTNGICCCILIFFPI